MMIETLSDRDQTLERQILAGIVVEKSIPDDLLPEYFCGDERKFFDELMRQYSEHKKIDVNAMIQFNHEIYEAITSELAAMTISEIAIRNLRTFWQRRELSNTIAMALKNIDSPDSAISQMEQRFHTIKTAGIRQKVVYGEAMSDVLQHIEDGMVSGKCVPGFGTGIHWLDILSGGIERGKFYIIGGLKKTGKSRFLVHLGIQACKRGANLMFNSLEMSPQQLISLCFAYFSGVNSREIGRKLTTAEHANIMSAASHVNSLNWMICREKYVDGLRSQIAYNRKSRLVDIVFVDFIQRMRSQQYKNDRVREVESISQGLADLSREMNIAVVALSQLSKDAERMDGIPDMSCLKESQGIAENADSIWVLHNPDRKKHTDSDEQYHANNMQLLIEQRYDVSGRVVYMLADMRTCVFTENNFQEKDFAN